MFVTAYFDIGQDKLKSYLEKFQKLSKLRMILFTDPSLESTFSGLSSTVKVEAVCLQDLEIFRLCQQFENLPTCRNSEKDTKDFLSLMNTKVEFLKLAKELCEDETLIWIDFGIMKIVKNEELVLHKLEEIQKSKVEKVTLPGCWCPCIPSPHQVCWRFCGGLVVCPRDQVEEFREGVLSVLQRSEILTWEVNVWTVLEQESNLFSWYRGDHNDSMFLNFQS